VEYRGGQSTNVLKFSSQAKTIGDVEFARYIWGLSGNICKKCKDCFTLFLLVSPKSNPKEKPVTCICTALRLEIFQEAQILYKTENKTKLQV